MGIKNNLNYIKDEFSSDEKLIQNAFRLELLYKRYKYYIWAILGVIIFLGVGFFIKDIIVENNANKSSAIFSKLAENPSDTNLKNELKNTNEKLYRLFLLQEALNAGNLADLKELGAKNDLIGYIANYHYGSFERDTGVLNKIDKYALGDLARVETAYILMMDNKISEAKNILQKISQDSQLTPIAQSLLHFSITKNDIR